MSEATFDWLNTPIGQPQQPTPQPPQIPWNGILRWLPWVLLVAAAVFFYAKQSSVKLRDEIDAAKGQILFLDADDKTRELAPEWQRLRDRIQTRPPAVVIATPRRAKEMKLPASVDDFLAAIEGAK